MALRSLKIASLKLSLFTAWTVFIAILLAPAAAANEILEAKIRKQLERLFFAEQFFLDVSIEGGAANAEKPLPGLTVGPGTSGKTSVLLVLDLSISNERLKIAQEMVGRQVAADGLSDQVNVTVRREAVMKVPPKELAPLAPQGQSSQPAPSAEKSPEAQDPAKPEMTIYDFIETKRELATRVLVVLWSALASLVAIYALLSKVGRKDPGQVRVGEPVSGSSSSSSPSGNGVSTSAPAGRTALTKAEIYSKDAALHKLSLELVEEAGRAPEKIAGVITRWLESSEENVRFANMFLKNCDMKTVEAVCKHLHPSDAGIVVSKDTGDFDPFSEENRKVLGLMRGEIARLAANQSIKTKPEPLLFLRQITDDQLRKILEGESHQLVAMVSTQIPVHRLARFFESIPVEDCKKILEMVVDLNDVVEGDFVAIKAKLTEKLRGLSDVLVDDDSKVVTARQLLSSVGLASKQLELAGDLLATHPDTFQQIRKQVLLVSDLAWLPIRSAKIFYQSVDGETLAAAIGDSMFDKQNLLELMPEAIKEAYLRASQIEKSDSERIDSWRRIQGIFESLIGSGLISPSEMNLAKAKSDEALQAGGTPPVLIGAA